MGPAGPAACRAGVAGCRGTVLTTWRCGRRMLACRGVRLSGRMRGRCGFRGGGRFWRRARSGFVVGPGQRCHQQKQAHGTVSRDVLVQTHDVAPVQFNYPLVTSKPQPFQPESPVRTGIATIILPNARKRHLGSARQLGRPKCYPEGPDLADPESPRSYQPTGLPWFCWSSHFCSGAK